MNFLDILFLIILVIFTTRGFFRGIVREAISLVSIILAFTLASRYHGVLAPHLGVYINNEATIRGISYVLVFLGVLIVCWLIARLIREMLEIALLGWADRLAGLAFGLVEGTVVILLTLMVLGSFFKDSDFMKESLFVPKAEPVLAFVMHHAPDSLKETLRKRGLTVPESDKAPKIMPDHPEPDGLIEDTVENPEAASI
ncbi:CvpA family protein [Salidesulfovibrio brasiliensis]|uniref:CvpA family protein n=1 Tax=Salidesulfovibrio brasiliensis TaxID=221711 RepID=UPI0006D08037|nr:CvpA family protein [Salidesulfovibrio brasiliensis]